MKRIRFAYIFSASPSPHSIGGWRHRRSYRGFDWHSPEYWEHVARTLERGKIDMAFFADSLQLHDEFEGSAENAIKYAVMVPRLDPAPYIPVMARATNGLGFGLTSSTSYIEPFYLARKFATLDYITNGRIAWNIVASYGQSEARAFGRDGQQSHQDRYARAEEFTELCYRLWDSWEDGAILANRRTGVYADPSKVRCFQHEGDYFRSIGPLTSGRMPQGRPVIVQAGASGQGLEFAARHAEVHFAVRGSVEGMREHIAALRDKLPIAGRTPDQVNVLWNTTVYVGETEEEADRKWREVVDNVPVEAGITMLSGMLGADLSKIPPDEKVRNLDPETMKGSRGLFAALARDFGDDLTLGEAARYHGAGMSGLRIRGTPEQVADRLETLLEEGGGSGFMLRPTSHPGSVEDFVNLVIPVLQARGRVWNDYPHAHLRENLMTG